MKALERSLKLLYAKNPYICDFLPLLSDDDAVNVLNTSFGMFQHHLPDLNSFVTDNRYQWAKRWLIVTDFIKKVFCQNLYVYDGI